MCFTGAKKCLFYHFFMECHSIQFTTISINVERGIVKILFKYRYFQDLLIDIDIDIDISQILLIDIDIDIFQNHHIDIDIFGIALSISISISIFFRIALSTSIFSKMTISILISISIFFKCRYIGNRYVISIYRTGLSRTVERGEGRKEQVELGIVRREGRSSEPKKIPG